MGATQVDNQDSFDNISSKWIAEINENCPGVKMVLAALKCDLRKDEEMNDNPNAITFDQGLAKAKDIGAVKYLGGFWNQILRCLTLHALLIDINTGCLRMLRRAKSWYSRNLL
jgi:GTPase SAR1 family protein